MTYNYVTCLGGTDSAIHLVCPKCQSINVTTVVLEDGHYGVEKCQECGHNDPHVEARLNGKTIK